MTRTVVATISVGTNVITSSIVGSLTFINIFKFKVQVNHILSSVQTYVTGSAKSRHNSIFFKFHFIIFFTIYIPKCVHILVKFELQILRTFEVTDLQSSSNRKIDLYNKYRENNLQTLTKMSVTLEWSAAETQNLCHHVSIS